MPKYICDDGNAEIEIDADTPTAAAQEYVDSGDWGTITDTTWIDVYVQQDTSDIEDRLAGLIGEHQYTEFRDCFGWSVHDAADLDIEVLRSALSECKITLDGDGDLLVEHGYERDRVTIEVDPPEPECIDEHIHDWRSPYSVVGGIEENPGVNGHGGGVIIREVCAHCGRYRVGDTWAQRSDTGEQGLDSVHYEDADDESAAWVVGRVARAACTAAGLDAPRFVERWMTYPASEDEEEQEADLEHLNDALPPGYQAFWTGSYGRSDLPDIVIEGPF